MWEGRDVEEEMNEGQGFEAQLNQGARVQGIGTVPCRARSTKHGE